jgi:hypothetical protein
MALMTPPAPALFARNYPVTPFIPSKGKPHGFIIGGGQTIKHAQAIAQR